MLTGDTIAAIASPLGRSARGLVRVSGPATGRVVEVVLDGGGAQAGIAAARLRLGAGELPVLVTRFAMGKSFTGEEGLEIQTPGNPLLLERVLGAVLGVEGVRRAEPGEFAARAFLAGRMTLDQAEGVAAMIAAVSDEDLAAARELMDGRTGEAYRRWSEELATLLALVEAGIDFTDQEDVIAIAPGQLARRLDGLIGLVHAQLGAAAREAGGALPRAMLVGVPNAGKSTLFNALLGRRRAVASALAGTTRDVLEEELDLSADAPGAGRVLLMDSPGVDGEGGDGAEGRAQGATQAAAGRVDVLIWCDPTGRFDERRVMSLAGGAAVIRVRTCADRGATGDGLAVCALDGSNLGTLRRAIADAVGSSRAASAAGLVARHRASLARAAGCMARARAAVDPEARMLARPEAVASALREGLDSLGELVGQISPDDIIGRVFATFCVGK